MLDFTNIDAIQFLQDTVNNIRVYYQNADKTIRESCFDDKRKWYTTGDIITTVARENSPIAVTRWNGGTEIRVYFLIASNKICKMVGKSEVGQPDKWEQGGDLSAASVASISQIGIARPGRDDSSLRVYYQEATTNKLREIMYWEEGEGWSVSSLEISEAMVGTRLSVVSAKPPGNVRLYYQGVDGNLKEHFFKQQGLEWCPSNLPSIALIAKAPICATCWYADNKESNPRDLRIRVFTIPQSSSKSVAQIVFNLNQGYASAIAACQTTDVAKGAISVFYQPDSQIIDLKPVGVSHGNAGLAEVKDVVIPRGIPFHHAAMNGDLVAAQTIVDSKAAGFDVKDNDKRYPLYYAIANKHTSVAILLARKWNISDVLVTAFINDNSHNHKAIALFDAVERNDTTRVGFLIEIGANVDVQGYGRYSARIDTPLHSAAYFSRDEGIIKMLLDAGANKYIEDQYGNRPYSATWNGLRWSILA